MARDSVAAVTVPLPPVESAQHRHMAVIDADHQATRSPLKSAAALPREFISQ